MSQGAMASRTKQECLKITLELESTKANRLYLPEKLIS